MKEIDNKKILNSSHLDTLEKLLSNVKYGNVTIIIQDGKIVQIDKTEKFRIKD